jgi:hypothetical protein
MNVEIWTEAAQFPEKEYINVIFVAVYSYVRHWCTSVTSLRPGELFLERATGLAKVQDPCRKLIFPFSVSANHCANSSAK